MSLPPKVKQIRGLVVGRLVVTCPVGIGSGGMHWQCVCRCGKRVTVRATCLIRRLTKSCGCLISDTVRKRTWKHGKGRTPLAGVWRQMISRCHNPKDPSYRRYGGRGIAVCERWRASFEQFERDVGPRPDGHQLDRINNDGNYEPGNCRWATSKTNNRNRGNNIKVTLGELTLTLVEWSERTGIKYGTIWNRFKSGWPPEKMLSVT